MSRAALAAALLALAGCGPNPPAAPPDTGAADTARGFFDGLVRRDHRAAS